MNQQQTRLKALKNSLSYFSKNCLHIKTKDAKIIPFVFNRSQEYFHSKIEEQLKKTGKVRALVVKGRQSGISTYVAARFYHKTSTNKALSTFILSHESSTTDKLFKIVKLYNESNPVAPETRRSNAKELDFAGLNSQYYVGTAGSGEVGRGGTVQLFHGSEVAMWKNTDDIETGLMESIPDMDGTEVVLESTAKGMGNYFHRMVVDALKGENDYEVVFLPWYWQDEYEQDASEFTPNEDDIDYADLHLQEFDEDKTLRKLAWRRNKISNLGSDWKFKQEYPADVHEAFQTSGETLILAQNILRARKQQVINNSSPLVLGVDPARVGDRAAIAFRRGRELEAIYSWENLGDDMQFVGKIATYIEKYKPIAVNIDCTNSYAIYDRLKELGHNVVHAIHFASKASEDRLYMNKRVEMWCNLRDWVAEDGTSIPDDDEIHADFMAVPDYKETSDGRIRLDSKENIKKVFGMSPDLGDAAALTFAVPVAAAAMQKRVIRKGAGLKSAKLGKK